MPVTQSPNVSTADGGDFALITGASSGIGACFVHALAARGRNLVLVARSRDKLEALAGEIRGKHAIRIEVVALDLTVDGAPRSLAATLQERAVSVDLLVNNAGFGAQGEFWKLPLDRQTQMLGLNIVALTELTHLMLPAMIARRRGGIINVSSTAGFQPVPYTSVYGATKAYVTSFSMAIAVEAQAYGIKVLALCPGGTATNFFAASQWAKRDFVGGLQSPEEVVEVGLRAFDRGKSLVISRWRDRLMVFSQRLAPRWLPAQIAANMFRPKDAGPGD
jgi:short-subunit dehydrogenase